MAQRYDPSDFSGGPGDGGFGSDGFGRGADGDGPSYAWIGEWLCEYVDGTMDPSMQAVFEEYMEANPELEEHVERLCRTRTLLRECGCRDAAERAKAELIRMARAASSRPASSAGDSFAAMPFPEEPPAGLANTRTDDPNEDDTEEDAPLAIPMSAGTVIAVASAMTLMLGVGMATGALLFSGAPAERVQATASQAVPQEQAEHAADRLQAPSRPPKSRAAAGGTSPWTAPAPSPPIYDWSSAPHDTVSASLSSRPDVLYPLVRQAGLGASQSR